jgi:hypothetical protein
MPCPPCAHLNETAQIEPGRNFSRKDVRIAALSTADPERKAQTSTGGGAWHPGDRITTSTEPSVFNRNTCRSAHAGQSR